MARTAHDDPDAALERELGQLKAEYEKLREEKVRAEQTLAHLESELSALRDKALEEYGTADTGELKARLDAMRVENGRRVEEYRQHIASIRDGLAALERGLDEVGQ